MVAESALVVAYQPVAVVLLVTEGCSIFCVAVLVLAVLAVCLAAADPCVAAEAAFHWQGPVAGHPEGEPELDRRSSRARGW